MNERSKSEWKELHAKIRDDAKKAGSSRLKYTTKYGWEGYIGHRWMLLLWGFVRGFKFRRIERIHRMQDGKEYNLPDPKYLLEIWKLYLPELGLAEIQYWLDDPSGAIPAPPARVKKEFEPAAE